MVERRTRRRVRARMARLEESEKGGRGAGDETAGNKAEERGTECSRGQGILHVTRSGMEFWFLRLAHH